MNTGRAKTIPIMGQQPKLVAGQLSRPEMIARPTEYSSEPTALPDPRTSMPKPTYESTVPRPVVEAEIDELLEWGMVRLQHRWPRCTEQSIKPLLIMATRGGRYRFLRTSSAMALFEAVTDAFEPERIVRTIFVESKPSIGGRGRPIVEDEGSAPAVTRASNLEIPNLYKAGKKWAEEIQAREYLYEESTGTDIEPISHDVGTDSRRVWHSVLLNKSSLEMAAE